MQELLDLLCEHDILMTGVRKQGRIACRLQLADTRNVVVSITTTFVPEGISVDTMIEHFVKPAIEALEKAGV